MNVDAAHAYAELVGRRRSVRAYLPQPLPEALIRGILATAQQAPSNCNVQPWQVHIVSGAARERLAAAMYAEGEAGRMTLDLPRVGHYPGKYRERQVGAAKALFAATGVGRDDPAGRKQSMLRNYSMFDAPHAAFIFMPRAFGLREAVDVGIYAQTFMLGASAHGVASCAQGALTHHAAILHRELAVAEDLLCMLGISFGWADEAHPANGVRTGRAPLEEAAHFHT
jgi:nitroreductase